MDTEVPASGLKSDVDWEPETHSDTTSQRRWEGCSHHQKKRKRHKKRWSWLGLEETMATESATKNDYKTRHVTNRVVNVTTCTKHQFWHLMRHKISHENKWWIQIQLQKSPLKDTHLWLYRFSFWKPSLPSAPFATGRLSKLAIKVLMQERNSSRYRHSISLSTNLGMSLRF